MIEASAVEMVRHLDLPPPLKPLSQFWPDDGVRADVARHLAALERATVEYEAAIARWVEIAERNLRAVADDFKSDPPGAEDIAALEAYVTRSEAALADEASYFVRQRETVARETRSIAGLTAAERKAADGASRRYIAALSRRGLVKADAVSILRTLIGEARPDSGRGPVFDDPEALAAYLREAIA